MKALELLEYLAVNARYKAPAFEMILSNQTAIVKQAYIENNSEMMRMHLSNGKLLADKNTVFQV